jgi:hypothetical protein
MNAQLDGVEGQVLEVDGKGHRSNWDGGRGYARLCTEGHRSHCQRDGCMLHSGSGWKEGREDRRCSRRDGGGWDDAVEDGRGSSGDCDDGNGWRYDHRGGRRRSHLGRLRL